MLISSVTILGNELFKKQIQFFFNFEILKYVYKDGAHIFQNAYNRTHQIEISAIKIVSGKNVLFHVLFT